MPPCHDVALRLARDDSDTLPFYKKIMMRLHLSMCKACGPFERQLSTLSKAFRTKWGNSVDPVSLEELKKKLKKEFVS